MKFRLRLLIILFFLLISFAASAQQQGIGIIFNDVPLIGKASQNLSDNPVSQYPPICGKKRRNEGFNLPYPFGTGIHGMWYQQDYLASNLLVTDSTGNITVTADTMIQNTTASEMTLSFRPDVWLLPFLNVYGIFGYTKGKVKPNLTVPAFTMHIRDHDVLPDSDIPIDTTFEIKEEMVYNGPTVGVGLTFAMGFNAFFVVLDYNYTETYPNDNAEKLVKHSVSPKIGIQLASRKGEGRGTLWLGGMFMSNKQKFGGILNVEEIDPIVAIILGKEADYSGDIENIQQWNMLIGGSYFINKHHSLFAELGFIGRQQASLGYGFRF